MTEPPIVTLEQPPERTSSRGPKRWLMIGCMAALVAVIAVLYLSVSAVKRGMYSLVERGSERVVRRLPFELRPDLRERVLENLDLLQRELPRMADRDRVVGGFVGRVGKALRDDRLSVAEVREINDYVESVLGREDVREGAEESHGPGPERAPAPP